MIWGRGVTMTQLTITQARRGLLNLPEGSHGCLRAG
jgi:hypothetical protein